jgi:hypothetical protein
MNERCFYCLRGEGPFHEDHVVPFSRGGTSLPRNLVLACEKCNLEKSDRLPSEWKNDLHERVYKLEADLVEWHQDVDERKRVRQQGLYVGSVVGIDSAPFVVECVDSKGLRLRPLFPKEGREGTEESDYGLGDFSKWLSWACVKSALIANSESPLEKGALLAWMFQHHWDPDRNKWCEEGPSGLGSILKRRR